MTFWKFWRKVFPMTDNFRIELKNVHKSFPVGETLFEALKGITLSISDGEFLGLVGPSGSGKTTLLNLIGGLDEPTAGSVIVSGKDLSLHSENELSDFRNESIGFVFQTFNLLPVYTAYENTEFPLLLQPDHNRGNNKELVEELLEEGWTCR